MRSICDPACGKSAPKDKTKPHRNGKKDFQRCPQKGGAAFHYLLGGVPPIPYKSVILMKGLDGCYLSIMVHRAMAKNGKNNGKKWQTPPQKMAKVHQKTRQTPTEMAKRM